MDGSMDDAMDKTPGGLNSSCIWCLSNYSPVTDSNGDKNEQLQLYRKKRYKLVLEYLLQNDTVHYTSHQANEDQHRRHLLLRKLLELRDTEMAASESALYELCPACAGKADEVMRLHLALEVIQMKLVDKISCLTEAVITNSMYGSNEVTKKRMQELEIWLQQQEQGNETGEMLGEVERLKNYMGTLEQFQTLIFEGGSKPRSVPCVYLQRCMPTSSFSAEEKVAIDCGVADMNMTEDFINVNIPPPNWPTASLQSPSLSSRPSPQTRVKRAKLSKTEAKVNTSSKRSTSRKTLKSKPRNTRTRIPKQTKIATFEQLSPDEKKTVPPTSYIIEDGLGNEIKEEPDEEDLPPSPLNPEGFQFQEPDQFLSQVDPAQAAAEVKVEDEDREQQGLGKRRRVRPVRFCPLNFNQPVCLPKPRQGTGITKEQHKLVTGAPKRLLKMFHPKRSKLTERQRRLLMNRKKTPTEFPCSSCNFVGETSSVFIHHLRSHETEEKVFECKEPDCEERHFSEKQFYDFHTRLHKPSSGFYSKCGICARTFAPPTLTTHMKSHEGTAVFPCSSCYFCTSKLKDYLSHLKHHVRVKLTPLPEFTCPLCPKLFPKQRDIIAEITRHLYNDHGCNDLLLKCEFKGCPASFLFNVALKNHYNIHLKRFKCDRCKEAFISNSALRSHVQTVHLKLKLFMCNVGDCPQNFKWQGQLDAHQVQCHDFPKFKCEHCPLEFTNTDARRGHMRRTHKDKSYVCVTCGKACPTVSSLKLHETMHFEKTVACDQCDFVTKSKHHLKKHKNTQHRTAPMKYECPHCPKRFNYKRAMEDHTRTHTGERPHQCHICSVAFAKKQPLDNHIRKVHANQEKKDDAGTGTVPITKIPTDVVIPVANNASGTSTASFVAL